MADYRNYKFKEFDPIPLSFKNPYLEVDQEAAEPFSPHKVAVPEEKKNFGDVYNGLANQANGPAMSAYMQYLQTGAPKEENYKPSKMRRLAAALSGAAVGFRDPAGGIAAAQSINNIPYEQELRKHDTREKQLRAAAGIEENLMQHRINALKLTEESRRAQEKLDLEAKNIASQIQNRTVTAELGRERIDLLRKQAQLTGLDLEYDEVSGELKRINKLTGEVTSLGKFKESKKEEENRLRGRESHEQGLIASRERAMAGIRFSQTVGIEQLRNQNNKDLETQRQTGRESLENKRQQRQATTSVIPSRKLTENITRVRALIKDNSTRYHPGIIEEDESNPGEYILKDKKDVPAKDLQAWQEIYDTLYNGFTKKESPSTTPKVTTTPGGRKVKRDE
jgi:hypothetical protein